MQSINTVNLNTMNATVLVQPPVSDDLVNFPPKRAPTSEMDGIGKLVYSDIAEVSVLAGDFVSLAQTTLALIESDGKRAPDIDTKEALDLAHLRRAKAEMEQVLKSAASHVDLTEGAMEMRLVMLSIELSEIIDKLLKGRMQSQKDRNGQIDAFTELQNALRKMEKSTDAFDAATLNKFDRTPPPGSQMAQRSVERARAEMEKGKAVATANEKAVCDRNLAWALTYQVCNVRYKRLIGMGFNFKVTTNQWGEFELWNNKGQGMSLRPPYNGFYPSWGKVQLKDAYEAKQQAFKKCDDDFNAHMASGGKVSLNDMLIDYGVYKEGEKLPATKEDLEAATEKISSMVNSINSVQGMKMLDIQKFTNGRNEAYDLAVKVNTTKFDSLNALIRMIGDR